MGRDLNRCSFFIFFSRSTELKLKFTCLKQFYFELVQTFHELELQYSLKIDSKQYLIESVRINRIKMLNIIIKSEDQLKGQSHQILAYILGSEKLN